MTAYLKGQQGHFTLNEKFSVKYKGSLSMLVVEYQSEM